MLDEHTKDLPLEKISLKDLGTSVINANRDSRNTGHALVSSAYSRYMPIGQAHYSAGALTRLDNSPTRFHRDVKTYYDLPFPSSPVSTYLELSYHSPDSSSVIVIDRINIDLMPNGLKGVCNLFSNYGNVERVTCTPAHRCSVWYQVAAGAAIAQRELSALGDSL